MRNMKGEKDMRKTIQTVLIVLLFSSVIMLLVACLPHKDEKESFIPEKGDSNAMNETMPSVSMNLQNFPIVFSNETDSTAFIPAQKQFSKEDFASLVEGMSTLNDLFPIIGCYPAKATSYGFLYQFNLSDGGELSIQVDNNGIIFKIYDLSEPEK